MNLLVSLCGDYGIHWQEWGVTVLYRHTFCFITVNALRSFGLDGDFVPMSNYFLINIEDLN